MTAEVNDLRDTDVDYCKARTTKCFLRHKSINILHEIDVYEVTLEK
jgi:hypothetical protein